MIPGTNLLNRAFGLIAKQTVGYLRSQGETPNALGYKIEQYAPRIELQGSFQPVPRRLYQVYGLDMEKNYATFYVSKDAQDIQRGNVPDLIEFNGRRWLCQSENDWFAVDGWTGILVVEIGPIPPAPPAFTGGEWEIVEIEGDAILRVTSYSGTIDYVERRINDGEWENIGGVPYVGNLPLTATTVSIRPVLQGVRGPETSKDVP